jgi:hypothetical protein
MPLIVLLKFQEPKEKKNSPEKMHTKLGEKDDPTVQEFVFQLLLYEPVS